MVVGQHATGVITFDPDSLLLEPIKYNGPLKVGKGTPIGSGSVQAAFACPVVVEIPSIELKLKSYWCKHAISDGSKYFLQVLVHTIDDLAQMKMNDLGCVSTDENGIRLPYIGEPS